MGTAADRIGFSWLPPYHDMGLMGTIMLAVHGGWPLIMLSPVHFVQQPYRWLKALTDYRVTISVAPNFALDMCADTITDSELCTLDLSSLRQLYCGAEPVLSSTLARFRARFEPCGYQGSALIPCYGMAEATLFLSGKPDGTGPRSRWLDKTALEQGTVQLAAPGITSATEIMSCGVAATGHELVIVDPTTCQAAGPGTIGELWVSGPNVAQGYFRRPDLTAQTFAARLPPGSPATPGPDRTYLRTGDAGFLQDGELYITGRIKDVVIIAGRNLYPHDIEASVLTAHPDLRRAAAFSVRQEQREEQLVVVAEFRRAGRRTQESLAEAREAVLSAVAAEHAVRLSALHLGPPGTVFTTTSGKVRRAATRQAYITGALKSLGPASPADAFPVPGAVGALGGSSQ
jgi:acyl-CoA synthetase (AMP-forming)/AMP-acid ligase II